MDGKPMMMQDEIDKLIDNINEIQIDRTQDHLKNIRKFQQNKFSIPFIINNNEYEFVIVETELDNESKIASVVFKNMTAMKSVTRNDGESMDSYNSRIQNNKFGITNTGNSMRVFSKVINIFIAYLEKYKPSFIQYFAEEDNRKRLYNKLLDRVKSKASIKFIPQSLDPISGNSTQSSEFVFKLEFNS